MILFKFLCCIIIILNIGLRVSGNDRCHECNAETYVRLNVKPVGRPRTNVTQWFCMRTYDIIVNISGYMAS